MSRRAQERGLSLVELVAAMAVFALVAVVGAQALGGMIRLREGLVLRSDRTAELDQAVALLRADLSALVPMLFYPPGGAAPQSAARFRNAELALSARGRGGAELQRIEWQLRNGQLSRRFWPALIPARSSAAAPWVPVLEGVTALRLRSYWPDIGWVQGAASLQANAPANALAGAATADSDRSGGAPGVYSSTLPLALELVLDTREFGAITLVETLK